MLSTLIGGCCKLIYDKLRIKKYTKEAEARKSHLESVQGTLQIKTDEIPFGIKALEAGLEVEGIVISRPNTPARYTQSQVTLVASDASSTKSRGQGPPSPRFAQGRGSASSSPAPSMKGARPMVYQPSPYIQLPPASYMGGTSVRSSASSLAPTPPITRSPSAEKMSQVRQPFPDTFVGQETSWQQSGKSMPTLPDAETLAKLEGRHSQASYDYRKSAQRNSSRTPSPPESHLSKSLPSVDENEVSEESSRESDSSLDHLPHPRSSRPELLATYSSPSLPSQIHRPLPESAQGDLSLLHTHRLSHAAEVGQLLPRRRDPNAVGFGGAPISTPGTPVSFYLPATSDPVYALDIAIPNGGLEGLQFPTPSYTANPSAKRERKVVLDLALEPFDGVWISQPGDGQNSRRGGVGSPEASFVPGDQILRPSSSDSDSPERKSTKGKGKKLQKK